MPTLADQVREMMRILEVVDPQAAASIKGTSQVYAPMAAVAAEPAYQPPPAPVRRAEKIMAGLPETVPSSGHKENIVLPFHADLTPEKLAQAVIWSEIISKPVSRRRK